MFTDDDFELSWKEKGFYSENPYYNPESWGLHIVGQIELSEPDYSFDTLVVWKSKNGKVYFAQDSGCSCPIPFEDFHGYGQLIELTSNTINTLRDIIKTEYAISHGAQDLLYKVRDYLK